MNKTDWGLFFYTFTAFFFGYLSFEHFRYLKKCIILIRRSKNQATDQIEDLITEKKGKLVEVMAYLSDLENYVSPISQIPCAWWRCNVYVTYVKSSGKNISGGERLHTEINSGNNWIFAKTSKHLLPIYIHNTRMIPQCSFSESTSIMNSASQKFQHFINSTLKSYLKKNSIDATFIDQLCSLKVEAQLGIRIVEWILPLETPHYVIGGLDFYNERKGTSHLNSEIKNFHDDKIIQNCIFSKDTIISCSDESAAIKSIMQTSNFEALMGIGTLIMAIGLIVLCISQFQTELNLLLSRTLDFITIKF